MRIEVSVPGIRKERGKLPAPRSLGVLRLAAGPPVCSELDSPSLGAPAIGAGVGTPRATTHPVSANPTRSAPVRLTSQPLQRLPPLSADRGALLHSRRLRGIEPLVALFDAASPLVPGNDDANMVRASALACSGDFLLRLASC